MGFSHPDLADRVTFIRANMSKPLFGLFRATYAVVQRHISHYS